MTEQPKPTAPAPAPEEPARRRRFGLFRGGRPTATKNTAPPVTASAVAVAEKTDKPETKDPKKTDEGTKKRQPLPTTRPPGAPPDPWSVFAATQDQQPGRLRRGLRAALRTLIREYALMVYAGCLLAVAMTWPTLRYPMYTLPQDLGDPSRQAWQMSWLGHILITDPVRLWQSNAYFPAADAFAFGDNLLGYALAGILGTGPSAAILRYNIVFVLAHALLVIGAYALVRQLGARKTGAAVAAVAFAYAPWRLAQEGHLDIISAGGIPLALAMLVRGHGYSLRYGFRADRRSAAWAITGWLVAIWQLTLGFSLGVPFAYVLGLLLLCLFVAGVVHHLRPMPKEARPEKTGSRKALFTKALFTKAVFTKARPKKDDKSSGTDPSAAGKADPSAAGKADPSAAGKQAEAKAHEAPPAPEVGKASADPEVGKASVAPAIGKVQPLTEAGRAQAIAKAGKPLKDTTVQPALDLSKADVLESPRRRNPARFFRFLRFFLPPPKPDPAKSRKPRRKPLIGVLLTNVNIMGATIFTAVGILIAVPYIRRDDTGSRLQEITFFSPPLRSLLIGPAESRIWGAAHETPRTSLGWAAEMSLLPGFTLYALALAGLFLSIWRLRHRLLLATGLAAAIVLTLGTNFFDGRWTYMPLFGHFPASFDLRIPGRLMLWVTLLLAILAAGAVDDFVRRAEHLAALRIPPWPGPWLRLATLIPLILVALEGWNTTAHPVVPAQPAALRTVPGPMLVLPTAELTDQTVQLWTTTRFQDVTNGGGSFNAQAQAEMRAKVATFPDATSVAYLDSLGVRRVLLLSDHIAGTAWEDAGDLPVESLGLRREDVPGAVVFTLD
ncbi:hypothetical protein Ait01nite_050980 [Actinoplanes italicus]|uniref:Uncharacterized protein n=1 Tax=Actinoplanes italicus TaxID=113567 RepID=A0A2T0KC44_9ACTN|nr:hypothetical protein [Actinoplanes italicus]PRX20586.1 hypothetical protein CLV67_108387 [Actinoplanes italicus]GIE32053.1 hypothetical protein Ait01nite_050980 [Actinoplanes italicus]